MDKLIKRVLPVGSRLAPENWPRLHVNQLTGPVDAFAVTLHVALLEVCGEAMHVLVIRQNGLCLRSKEVVVPDADQRQQADHVGFGYRERFENARPSSGRR